MINPGKVQTSLLYLESLAPKHLFRDEREKGSALVREKRGQPLKLENYDVNYP
jgi:hypothetical protein